MDQSELATIKDTLKDTLHDQLDVQVNQDPFVQAVCKATSLAPTFAAAGLLTTIVRRSHGRLHRAYRLFEDAYILVKENPSLETKLHEALEIKKYRSIRLLEILQHPRRPLGDHEPFLMAFICPFLGAGVDGLCEYLENNDRLFRDNSQGKPYYARICSVVQSSGTGKSRTLVELSKRNIVVLYINLREDDDMSGFPFRDPIPSKILTESTDQYEAICYAFMIALFETLEQYLSEAVATEGANNAVNDWNEKMCDMNPCTNRVRYEFFSNVEDAYCKHLVRILTNSRGTGSQEQYNRRFVLIAAYKKLGVCLDTIISGAPNLPRLVIAFDEAHTLLDNDILARVINVYSHVQYAIWVVLASTTASVADISLPDLKYQSIYNFTYDHQPFRPYTKLGWDQHVMGLGNINADDIAKVAHVVKFGRPLWMSLVASVNDSKGMLMIASEKLCGAPIFDVDNIAHVLAVFAQRIGLEVTLGHPDAVELLKKGVASHLRIFLGRTLNRNWSYTSYPSEPLLSCAVAHQLHCAADNLSRALETLKKMIGEGLINISDRGELASRLLWLLAKDLYVRKHFTYATEGLVTREPDERGDSWQSELLDCKMIPVVGWLEFIFGERAFGKSDEDRQRARECFAGAYINFSHWISMDGILSGSTGDQLPLAEWTLLHLQRTSAVQCCHQQPRVDKVIPIYFKDPQNPVVAPNWMSQIFISDKARRSESSSESTTMNDITRQDVWLGGYPTDEVGENLREDLPYIAIQADFGLPSHFSTTFPSGDVALADRCLRIFVAGIDANTYPFLAQHPDLLVALQDIARPQQQQENERSYVQYLDAQMSFGKTATAAHMNWEHGRIIPALS